MVNGFTLGQKVTWSSAAGQLVGFIKSFNLELNGHKDMVYFVTIEVPVDLNPGSGFTILIILHILQLLPSQCLKWRQYNGNQTCNYCLE